MQKNSSLDNRDETPTQTADLYIYMVFLFPYNFCKNAPCEHEMDSALSTSLQCWSRLLRQGLFLPSDDAKDLFRGLVPIQTCDSVFGS